MSCPDLKPEEVIAKLKSKKAQEIFAANDVLAAYLFGSFASGRIHTHSDIDVAVIFNEELPHAEYFERRIELFNELSGLLNTDSLDVMPLNNAHPLLLFQVLKKKHLVYNYDNHFRAEFELKAFNEYTDLKPVLDQYSSAMHRRIKERGLR